jgi:hypothetical protein
VPDFAGPLSEADRASLKAVSERVPEAGPVLDTLVQRRPELFDGNDSVTGERFAAQLQSHLENGYLRAADAPGFVSFLKRLEDSTFSVRRAGYSHSGPLVMMTALQHPGLVLKLTEAARDGRSFPLRSLYDGDGPGQLRPTPPLANAFQQSWASGIGPVHGYELGLIEAVVRHLRPSHLPSDRPAERCDRVAVALSKLTGQELRYAWAYNLKTGDDLVQAMSSQGREGLSMADIGMTDRFGDRRKSHFPVFHDYDPKTHSVAMQDFSNRLTRLSLDGLRFDDYGNTRPALYYRPALGMEKFLTLDEQAAYYRRGGTAPENPRWGESAGSSDWL